MARVLGSGSGFLDRQRRASRIRHGNRHSAAVGYSGGGIAGAGRLAAARVHGMRVKARHALHQSP